MCPNTSDWISNNSPNNQPIVEELESVKTTAIPAFLALTGADNTDSFSAKGKPTYWKECEEANESILRSLTNLDKDEKLNEEILDGI